MMPTREDYASDPILFMRDLKWDGQQMQPWQEKLLRGLVADRASGKNLIIITPRPSNATTR